MGMSSGFPKIMETWSADEFEVGVFTVTCLNKTWIDRSRCFTLCVLKYWNNSIIYIFFSEYMLRKHNIKWMFVTIGLYAFFWTGPPLFGWSSYTQEPFKTSCTVNWTGKTPADITYNTLCTVFCYFLPVTLFVFCYYNVVKTTANRYLLYWGPIAQGGALVRQPGTDAWTKVQRNTP